MLYMYAIYVCYMLYGLYVFHAGHPKSCKFESKESNKNAEDKKASSERH